MGLSLNARGWSYQHAGRARRAVNEVSFGVAPGERVLLLGASGAGKSTLLQGIAGLLGDVEDGEASGELRIGGRDPLAARGDVGMLLQDPDSQVILARVGDDVAFGAENLGVPREEIWRRVPECLEAVGLNLALDTPTAGLSGGQKQRLALAGVLAMHPGVLLLDEPTANLDPEGVAEVRNSVNHVVRELGLTLMVVEHKVEAWWEIVDRVIVLDATTGVAADGPPKDVLARYGTSLAASGVWVPGALPQQRPRAAPIGQTLLTADGLSIGVRPGGAKHHIAIAEHVNATISEGGLLAVTGPNGSGKSTLALALAGLTKPVAGKLSASPLLAADAGSAPASWSSRQLVSRIGTVFQNPEHQFVRATVLDELMLGPHLAGQSGLTARVRVDELLVRLRLDGLVDAHPFTLSGGEKRRLSVATMLATAPRLLVLDEPTFGQDARTWVELVELLAGLLDDGVGAVAVTHDERFVAALANDTLQLAPFDRVERVIR